MRSGKGPLAGLLLLLSSSLQAGGRPSLEILLSDWGLTSAKEIGYVSVGLSKGETLRLHDARRSRPVLHEQVVFQTPPFRGPYFLVGHFDGGNVNRLGGSFNAFSRTPSEAALTIKIAGDGPASLVFSYRNRPPGFAGFWIHLFDSRLPPSERIFLDAAPFRYLGFRIRGMHGGESVMLQVSDRVWVAREDSLPVGPVAEFLPQGRVGTDWQTAWVPLDRIPPGIDRRELASLAFRVAGSEAGGLLIRDVVLAREKTEVASAPLRDALTPPPPAAMWLWETKRILASEAEQEALAGFCGRKGIRSLFVQIPYEVSEGDGQVHWDFEAMRRLVGRLRQAAVEVYALDGDPRFALTEQHGRVLALIRSVVEYNRKSTPDARIVGVRYDNEPYLLPRFQGGGRSEVIDQYIELLRKARRETSAGSLRLGVDIPFWFDGFNEFYEPVVPYRGRSVVGTILDLVDEVGVMDYRTVAYGADGVITHGEGELAEASRRGKKVFIGLETVSLPDETILDFEGGKGGERALVIEEIGGGRARLTLGSGGKGVVLTQRRSVKIPSSKITFFGKSEREMREVMEGAFREFSGYSSFAGFAIHSYESYRPWLERQEE